MIFDKFKKSKNKNEDDCPNCKSELEERFSFCPYCGLSLIDKEKERKNYGLLGRNEFADRTSANTMLAQNGFNFSDKIVSALFNTVMKSMEKQMKSIDKQMVRDMGNAEVRPVPGGFSIKISQKVKSNDKGDQERAEKTKTKRKGITEEQMQRMQSLERQTAESTIKRLSNKVICELNASGVKSPEDIFISKLESGYEIKAIGNKVYTKSIPVDLPLKSLAFDKDKVYIEFKTDEK
jgi:hypothetical protein